MKSWFLIVVLLFSKTFGFCLYPKKIYLNTFKRFCLVTRWRLKNVSRFRSNMICKNMKMFGTALHLQFQQYFKWQTTFEPLQIRKVYPARWKTKFLCCPRILVKCTDCVVMDRRGDCVLMNIWGTSSETNWEQYARICI